MRQAMAGTDALYTYSPIHDNEIRLLQFVDDGNYISAILESFSVENSLPPYYSTSYTWVSPGEDESHAPPRGFMMKIDGRSLPVLTSLQPFLQALRAKDMLIDGKWWWIDSICIDLTNLEERAGQVQLMQLIYRQLEEAIVWLGESSFDSDLAFDFIDFLDKTDQRDLSVAQVRSLLQGDEYHAHWAALKNLLSRRWWSRIWTVQEFVLPASVSLWCGMRSVSRVAMCNSITMADRCTSVGIKETLAFPYANNRKRAWVLYKARSQLGDNLTLSLVALAAYFCCMDATDERDRLYGLMALSTDSFLPSVDYSLSAQEVYLRFAQSFIAEHKSLDIICLASIYSAPLGSSQPSWVPDWHKQSALVVPSMASQSSKTYIGNLRGPEALEADPSFHYSASNNTVAMYSFEGSTLLARGVVVDTIDGLAASKNCEMVQSSEWSREKQQQQQFPGCSRAISVPCSPEDLLISVCRSLVLDRKDRYLRYAMSTVTFVQDFTLLLARIITGESSPSSPPKELQQWFEWTRALQIHGRTFESILHDSLFWANLVDPPDTAAAAPNEDEWLQDTFFGRFFDTVVRLSLRLMVSGMGHIGMATERAMKGDLICVLFGCSIPVLLRKSSYEDTFMLVGECFLDGHMNGSALGQPELHERTFAII